MSPLKLGKLPDCETVKISFAASTELNRVLEDCSQAYEAEYGLTEAVPDLIPHRLEAFIKADRGFRRKQVSVSAETDQAHKIA